MGTLDISARLRGFLTFDDRFSPQIPNATSIPGWAYLDVVSSDDFSPQEAQADICESYLYSAGAIAFIRLQPLPRPTLPAIHPPAPCSTPLHHLFRLQLEVGAAQVQRPKNLM